MGKSPTRAFASPVPSCSNLTDVRDLNNSVIETVKYLAAHIPVYFLKCLPDREAAEVCFKATSYKWLRYEPKGTCSL